MSYYAEFAARVGSHINHKSEAGRIGLGLAGIVIGVVLVTGSVATGGALVVVVVGSAATYGSIGMDIGKIVDNMAPPVVTADHFIGTGVDSVRLGKGIWPAARADSDDTKDAKDGEKMFEGSLIVLIGEDFKPLVRRQDKVLCGGSVVEGIDTIIVGGQPSQKGVPLDAKDSAFLKVLTWSIFVAGLGKGIAKVSTAKDGERLKEVLSPLLSVTQKSLELAGEKDVSGGIKKVKTVQKYKGELEKAFELLSKIKK